MAFKPLQFVVGKGGVGKSTVCAALALAAVHAGKRVLAVEFGAPGGLARIFGRVPTRPGAAIDVRSGLALCYIDGEAALAEYLELVVPIRRLLSAVLHSRVYRYFVAAAPGLKELMTVGKVWYEHDRKGADGRPLWDVIVVDAGASGHSLQYLQMPTTAAATFRAGLVHREALRVEALLKDADATAVHVVATPEDMPLTEAMEIVERLSGELELPIGQLLVNRCRRRSPAGVRDALAVLGSSTLADVEVGPGSPGGTGGPAGTGDADDVRDGIIAAAERSLAWEEIQERGIDRLESATGRRVRRLPLLVTEEFGSAELETLASLLVEHEPGAAA